MESVIKRRIIRNELYELRYAVQNCPFPPNYSQDYLFYDKIYEWNKIRIEQGFNCYAYAMQFNIPKLGFSNLYTPGFLSNSTPEEDFNEKTLIEAFIKDCEFLGLHCEETDLNAKVAANSYKIGIQFEIDEEDADFHFVRQNDDLTWSEKGGWNAELSLLDSPLGVDPFKLIKIMQISKPIRRF